MCYSNMLLKNAENLGLTVIKEKRRKKVPVPGKKRSLGRCPVEMRYKPERALTHIMIMSNSYRFYCVEMRYKPERALTQLTWRLSDLYQDVEMRYKPERALTLF